jgi:tight adherence protein B
MTTLLPLLAAAFTFALVTVFLQRRRAQDARRRVSAFVAPRHEPRAEESEQEPATKAESLVETVELWLVRRRAWGRLAQLLERADVRTRPAHVLAAVVGGTLILVALGGALGAAPIGILLLAAGAAVAARLVLAMRVERRRRAFDDQLPEFLASLASALRAGHSLNQAIAAVASDSPQPIAAEFERVLAEARLGRPVEDALADVGIRVRSGALDFVLDAILIQRQVGGSLASIFEVVAESVRQRQQFVLRVRALTSMGRLSAHVLLALPIAMAGGMSLLNRDYFAPLLGSPMGTKLVAAAVVMLVLGWLWLRRIVAAGGKVA